jgi:phage-related protein
MAIQHYESLDALRPLTESLQRLNTYFGEMIPRADGLTTAFRTLQQAFTDVTGSSILAVRTFTSSLVGLGSSLVNLIPFSSQITTAFSNLGTALGGLGGRIGSALGSIAGNIPGIQLLGTAFQKITGSAGAIVSAFSSIIGALGGIGAAVGQMTGAVLGLGAAMVQFVSLADPGIVQLFNLAVSDMMAVIGQGLAPILQVVTKVIRIAADSLTTWAPQLGQIIASLAEGLLPVVKIIFDVMSKLGQAINLVLVALAPIIVAFEQIYQAIFEALQPVLTSLIQIVSGVMVQALGALAKAVLYVTPYIIAFAQAMKEVFEWVGNAIKELLGFVGLTIPKFKEIDKNASVGAATRGASISSVDDVIKRALTSAYSTGIGPKKDPALDAALKTVSIAESLKTQADIILKNLKNLPKKFWAELDPELKTAITNFIEVVKKLAPIAGALPAMIREATDDIGGRVGIPPGALPHAPAGAAKAFEGALKVVLDPFGLFKKRPRGAVE